MPVGAASLPEVVSSPLTTLDQYSERILRSVSSYFAPRLQFSGSSHHDKERARGRLSLSGSDILWSSHDLAVDFRDSVARRDEGESQTLRFQYSLPVAGSKLKIMINNSEYAGVANNAGLRQDSRSEYQGLKLFASRPFWSWRGINVDSVFSHSEGTKRAFEDSGWVSDSSHRLSSFGLRCAGKRELPGGFEAGAGLTALGGTEYHESVSETAHSTDKSRFHKLAVSASLNRAFYRWDMAVNGRYQFAPEDLASSEYLQIAGPSMMRGFNGQSLSVSEGGWVRLDARSPGYAIPFMDATRSQVMFSVLRGWSPASGTNEEEFGASTGEIALQLKSPDFEARMSVGRILNVSGPAMDKPSRPDVSLSMSMAI